jgi:hypothetical protein
MREALQNTPETPFKQPGGLKRATICLQTGLVATPYCPNRGQGLFLAGHLPKSCDVHATAPKVLVPNVVGMTRGAAIAALKKLSIAYTVVEKEFTNVAAGTVAEQSPRAGSVATSATVVTLVVSKGAAAVAPPTALIAGPATAAVHDKVTFDGSGSTSGVGIASYLWSFGDGTGATGAVVTHRFEAVGTYEVTLRVTDTKGQRSSTTLKVTVN